MKSTPPRRNLSSRAVGRPARLEDSAVQKEAYYLWQERGCPIGADLDLWLEAEDRLRHQMPADDRSGAVTPCAPSLHFPLRQVTSPQQVALN